MEVQFSSKYYHTLTLAEAHTIWSPA